MRLTYLIPSEQTGQCRREKTWSEEPSTHEIPALNARMGQEQIDEILGEKGMWDHQKNTQSLTIKRKFGPPRGGR